MTDLENGMDEIQIAHRDEVLKRIANFKEKASDVVIQPIPEDSLDLGEMICALLTNIVGHIILFFIAIPGGFYQIEPK